LLARLFESLFALLLTLWVGSLWAVGLLVAPLLFATIDDRTLAGNVAGAIFSAEGWLGIGCGCYLLAYAMLRLGGRGARFPVIWIIVLMLVLTLAAQLGIQPLLAQIKASVAPLEVMQSAAGERFALWHAVSSALYLVQCGMGAGLVVLLRRGVLQ
jgi:hypothetical protein